jgi:hypothetical protein
MPGNVLTTGASVVCAHGGLVALPVGSPRVRAGGTPVVTMGSPVKIAGCASQHPPAGVGPCLTATWVSSAARVRVQGVPVLCSDSIAVATPTGTPLAILATQPRVRAR